MFSYKHSFHAGNHADIIKHIVLVQILQSLKQKDKPFLYLDTHSGSGHYRLGSFESEKTGEYLEGIAKLYEKDTALMPQAVSDYVKMIREYNRNKDLRYYPGSPSLALSLLREDDKAHLCELHPNEYENLRKNFGKDRRVLVKKTDGFNQIKASLPPHSRRGLVLVDPSYEIKSDYEKVLTSFLEGYKRFATGIYAIWYPVVLRSHIKKMTKDFHNTEIKKILQIEFAIKGDSNAKGMTASGMIVVNPPYQLYQSMKETLDYLVKTLAPETGSYTLHWICPE